MKQDRSTEGGFILVVVLVLMALLTTLLVGYSSLTAIEMATTKSTMNSFKGFYAAEAGLNARADAVRQIFVSGASPTGAPPDPDGTNAPCVGSNQGSGDFACSGYSFSDRKILTYLDEPPLSSKPIVIPRGEIYQNLFADESYYVVYSQASNSEGFPEALLEMHFRSRTVPVFQFPAFYNKDLEILRAESWLLAGPIHTNGDLYVGSDNNLDITGQVTVAADLYRGRKDADTCPGGAIRVMDPASLSDLPACTAGRQQISQSDVVAWDEMVNVGVDPLSVPGPDALEPLAGKPYWSNADLRVVLDLGGASPAIQVRDVDGSVNAAKTTQLTGCSATSTSLSLYSQRESGTIRMLDLDLQTLLNCSDLGPLLGINLASTGSAAPLLYLGVEGPDSATINLYGVRLYNAAELTTILPGPAVLQGLTVATDQAVYLQGDYNAVTKKPAAVLGDTINVLSNNWTDAASTSALSSRVPTDTTINAALLAGTETTGDAEGAGGQDGGDYRGGLESFIRLHEDWGGTVTLSYRGSFVSLSTPLHVNGAWVEGSPQYTAPLRDWGFDTDFEDPALLPPMSPSFVYLRQDLFVRRFEL